jgi:hypothetical protein
MRFGFPHSHAFPNGRVAVEDDGGAPPRCLAEFGDGVVVVAEWRRDGPDIILSVPAYRTARGSPIAPRRWRLSRGRDGSWRSRGMG